MENIENKQQEKTKEIDQAKRDLYVPSIAEVRSIVSINVHKNDRDFVFLLPDGTPYQECFDALIEGAKKVKEMASAIEAKKKADAKDKDKSDGKQK